MITKEQAQIGTNVKKNPNGPILTIQSEPDISNLVQVINAGGKEFSCFIQDLELYEEPTISLPISDAINPSHYNGMQVMDQMIAVFGLEKVRAFCEVNSFKYRMRAGKKKDNPIDQDIKKALWYEEQLQKLTYVPSI